MGAFGRNHKKKKRQRQTITPPNSPICENGDPWFPAIKRRRRFTLEEAKLLEDEYTSNPNPPQEKLQSLANNMNTSRKIVTTWFQNRRAKNKRKAKEDGKDKMHDYNSDTNSTVTTTSGAAAEILTSQQQQAQLVINHDQCYTYFQPPQQQCNNTEEEQEDFLLLPQQETCDYNEDILLLQQQAYQNFIINVSTSNIIPNINGYIDDNYLLPPSSSPSIACTRPLYVNLAELQLDYKPAENAAPIISAQKKPSSSSSSK